MTRPETMPNSRSLDLAQVKSQLIGLVQRELASNTPPPDQEDAFVDAIVRRVLEKAPVNLDVYQVRRLSSEIRAEVLGYGPISPQLEDPDVNEIMVNGPDKVYVEKNGKLVKTDIRFGSDMHVQSIIERIILPLGRRIDRKNPTVDARLPDGSRVNAVIPPVAIDGSSITIRKFSQKRLGIDDLIATGSLSEQMAEFLRACVVSRLNILISGGTGSGKTTLLNILSSYIPHDERIVTIEDAAELQLQQEHVLRLETQNPDPRGEGEVTTRALVRNALRMRPDRIVVGEVRGGEALDMLQAMNTGHDGSLTTLHANSPRDALSRVETMAMMSGLDLPLRVIREQVASAVDLIVQQERFRDGTRKITYVTEISGMEGDRIVVTDIFKYQQTGIGPDGEVIGAMEPTGLRPVFTTRLKEAGFNLGASIFMPTRAKFSEEDRSRRR